MYARKLSNKRYFASSWVCFCYVLGIFCSSQALAQNITRNTTTPTTQDLVFLAGQLMACWLIGFAAGSLIRFMRRFFEQV